MPNEPVAFTFKLVSINLLESGFSFDPKKRYPLVSYNHHIKVENGFDVERNIATSVVNVVLTDEEGGDKLAEVKANFTFEVEDLEKCFQACNSGNLDKTLLTTLNAIAISTTRGIMFMAFRGTHLHNAILPVIDPASLVAQVEE